MDWSINLKQRDKIALALGFIFLVIVLSNWFMNYSMKQVSGQFKSVYEDRLIPALDIAAIMERSYKNHLLLEEHILEGDRNTKNELNLAIKNNQYEIDSILVKFEATYLTDKERQNLESYKKAQHSLVNVQKAILAESSNFDTAARKSYNTTGKAAFQQVLNPLHDLSEIQETVGHELLDSAERQMNTIKVLSRLVIAMAVIIALLVATLLQTSRKLNSIKQQNYHLN
ncbi:MCP four helix bundle domain-containing protein [uncultured Pontibacter sp.]|uniref:MCP four helix bundle domain-containing protein n=1 Tax=uncultured Pontibacter sp. TaxID=453356 RepID=UPI00261989EC|nr:MCP four helix bundle domain-containing protein [uncultured Pontibacter sp.]